jgi:membrane protein DedA with SNARE-associated domain
VIEFLTTLLTTYQIPSIFIGAFFFGDSVILTGAYLAGELGWSPVPIFLAALAGTIVSDTLWFFFGKYFASRFSEVKFLKKEREKMSGFIARLVGERPWQALIMVKFLYGSRVAMILYCAASGISFWSFSLFNAIGAVVWLLVFIPLGYVAGMGISQVAPFIDALPAALAVLVASFIVFRIITIWMEKKIKNVPQQ